MSALSNQESGYEGQTFRTLDLDGGEVMYTAFTDCVFEGCSLREARLQGCQFRDCLFRDCDLSLTRVRACMFRNTRWEQSKAIGINWAEAGWPKGKPLFPSIDFFDSAISYSTFSGLRLNSLSIVRCVAREVDFTGTDLSGADFRDTDFSDSRFIQANLTDTDFTGARNYVISPTLNTLKRTKFSFPEAISLLRALDIVLTD